MQEWLVGRWCVCQGTSPHLWYKEHFIAAVKVACIRRRCPLALVWAGMFLVLYVTGMSLVSCMGWDVPCVLYVTGMFLVSYTGWDVPWVLYCAKEFFLM